MNLPNIQSSGLLNDLSAVVPNTGGNSQSFTAVNCPLPDGWVQYTVNPTDSLFRLSILHGITLAEIRRVNCLSEDAVIMQGEAIYVPRESVATITPFIASVIPTALPNLVSKPAQVSLPAQQDDDGEDEEPAPPPPPAPPTAVVDNDPTDPPPPPATQPPPPPSNSGGGDDDDDRGGRDDDDDDDDDRDDDDRGGRDDDDDDDKDDKDDKEDKDDKDDKEDKDKGKGGGKGGGKD